MKFVIPTVLTGLILSGCGTTNNYLAAKTKTVEYYRIFDIKTSANRQVISKAASDGLGRNVNNAQEATPIPGSAELPDHAGRFKLINPLEGSKLAALASMGGGNLDLRVVSCKDSSWTAKAQRSVSGSSELNLTACVFPYKAGYHLDLYAVFSKKEGGLMQISRDMANAMVGTPEEWTEKTFLDIVRSIRASTGAEVTLLEAQPEITGMPWLDGLDGARK